MPFFLIGFFVGIPLGAVIGSIATAGVTNFFLADCTRLWGDEFIRAHPDKQWITVVYSILVVSSYFGLFSLALKVAGYLQLNSLFIISYEITCVITAGIAVLSGFFEILTGVSPVLLGIKRHGLFYVRAPWLSQYIYSEETIDTVRTVGLVRVLVGLFLIVGSFLVSWIIFHCQSVFVDSWHMIIEFAQ